MTRDDGRLQLAHQVPMNELVDRLAIRSLRRTGAELVGPCPSCGGTDRFGVNLQKAVFLCRRCDAKGDQVALVRLVLGLDFPAALDWLVGAPQELTREQRAEQARRAAAHKREREAEAERRRRLAIRKAREIWNCALPADGTLIVEYLARRGLALRPGARPPRCFRYEPAARLVVPEADRRGEFVTVHEGPAMLAAIQGPDHSITGVHRTWIDLDQPKGKVIARHPTKPDELLPSKKVYGSKKGGAIRIHTPVEMECLIMAEGIETTMSAMIGGPRGRTGYWAGVDLGNMAGARKLGPGLKYAGIPDLTDQEAFVPPASVKHLVYVQDGDSEPKLTKAKLQAGLRRAMALRRGLTAKIVHPGDGIDMNDLLMGAEPVCKGD